MQNNVQSITSALASSHSQQGKQFQAVVSAKLLLFALVIPIEEREARLTEVFTPDELKCDAFKEQPWRELPIGTEEQISMAMGWLRRTLPVAEQVFINSQVTANWPYLKRIQEYKRMIQKQPDKKTEVMLSLNLTTQDIERAGLK